MRLKEIEDQECSVSDSKSRIIARLIGDGSIYRSGTNYTIKYEVSDRSSLEEFSRDIKEVYGLESSWGTNKSGITNEDISFVRLRSKRVYEDLMQYGPYHSGEWRIHEDIMQGEESIRRNFLKVLFSDDGSVSPSEKKVKLYSINRVGLGQVRKLLEGFDIESTIYPGYGSKRNVFGLVVSIFSELKKFYENIGFSLERKMKVLERVIAQ